MASFVLTNAYALINAVDLSNHVKEVNITYEAEEQDDTAMGDLTKSTAGGLKNWEMVFTFYQDFAGGSVDATLFPLVGGAAVTLEVRADTGARSATNPAYVAATGAICFNYQPFGNSVGEMAMAQATFKPGGAVPTLTR